MENDFIDKKKKKISEEISRSRFSIRFSFFFFFFPSYSLLEKAVSRVNRLTNFSISLPRLRRTQRSLWSELGSDTWWLLGIACMSRVYFAKRRVVSVFSSMLSAAFAPLFRSSSNVYSIRSRVFAQEISKHSVTRLASVATSSIYDGHRFLLSTTSSAKGQSFITGWQIRSRLLETLSNQLVDQLPEKLCVVYTQVRYSLTGVSVSIVSKI